MAFDIYMSDDGELLVGPDGDLQLVHGDEQIAQEVIFRLRTVKGDWVLSPNIGCSLEEFIGKPNTPLTHTAIEERIREALTFDFLLAYPEITVVDTPDEEGNNNEVFILIEFASLESDDRIVQVSGSLSLRTGQVFARSEISNYR